MLRVENASQSHVVPAMSGGLLGKVNEDVGGYQFHRSDFSRVEVGHDTRPERAPANERRGFFIWRNEVTPAAWRYWPRKHLTKVKLLPRLLSLPLSCA
jgi:hypothetical protein